MKSAVLTLLTLVILSPYAFAKNFRPDYSPKITDLMYIPKKGTITTDGGLGLNLVSESVTYKSRTLYKTSEKELCLDLKGRYSITDRMSLGVGVRYFPIDSRTTEHGIVSSAPNTETKSKHSGPTDPELEYKYRAYLQKNKSKYNMDLIVILSPKIGDREIGSATTDGNELRGGHKIRIGTEFGNDFVEADFIYGAFVDYQTSSTVKDNSDNSTIAWKPSINVAGKIGARGYLSERVYATGIVEVLYYLKQTSVGGGVTSKHSKAVGMDLQVSAGYVYRPEQLIFEGVILAGGNSVDSEVGTKEYDGIYSFKGVLFKTRYRF